MTIDMTKLLICIAIDTLGSANEAIPIVGEVMDVFYAPIAALLLRQLFQGSNVVLLLEFVEEILPFTDVLPLATICWVIETFFSGGDIARVLRIGDFGNEQMMKMRTEIQFNDDDTIIPRETRKESSVKDAVVVEAIRKDKKLLDEKK